MRCPKCQSKLLYRNEDDDIQCAYCGSILYTTTDKHKTTVDLSTPLFRQYETIPPGIDLLVCAMYRADDKSTYKEIGDRFGISYYMVRRILRRNK